MPFPSGVGFGELGALDVKHVPSLPQSQVPVPQFPATVTSGQFLWPESAVWLLRREMTDLEA